MNINADTAWLLSSRAGARRRAVRRSLVRRWECSRYGVAVRDFAPSSDDVFRSRYLGRDSQVDPLEVRAARLRGLSSLWMADRLVAILATSTVAEEIGAPSGSDWLVAWTYHNDNEGQTPHDVARRVKARREGR